MYIVQPRTNICTYIGSWRKASRYRWRSRSGGICLQVSISWQGSVKLCRCLYLVSLDRYIGYWEPKRRKSNDKVYIGFDLLTLISRFMYICIYILSLCADVGTFNPMLKAPPLVESRAIYYDPVASTRNTPDRPNGINFRRRDFDA